MGRALGAIGKQILADKAEAARQHYKTIDDSGNVALYDVEESSKRRRSSALRSAALFQKFTDYAGIQASDEGRD